MCLQRCSANNQIYWSEKRQRPHYTQKKRKRDRMIPKIGWNVFRFIVELKYSEHQKTTTAAAGTYQSQCA